MDNNIQIIDGAQLPRQKSTETSNIYPFMQATDPTSTLLKDMNTVKNTVNSIF